MDEQLLFALLELPGLQWLYMTVYSGRLYPQLASLKDLTWIDISHYCMNGTLPANLIERKSVLAVARGDDAIGYTNSGIGECGIT